MALLSAHAGIQQGQLHILQHCQLGDQIVLLEDEAQHLVADLRLLVVIHGGHVDAAQVIGAGGRHVQTADDIHGGGLAGAGLAHDSYKLPLVHGETDAVQGVDRLIAHLIDLINIL